MSDALKPEPVQATPVAAAGQQGRFTRLRTIQAQFLAVNLPLVILSLLVVFGVFEYFAYQITVHNLHE